MASRLLLVFLAWLVPRFLCTVVCHEKRRVCDDGGLGNQSLRYPALPCPLAHPCLFSVSPPCDCLPSPISVCTRPSHHTRYRVCLYVHNPSPPSAIRFPHTCVHVQECTSKYPVVREGSDSSAGQAEGQGGGFSALVTENTPCGMFSRPKTPIQVKA